MKPIGVFSLLVTVLVSACVSTTPVPEDSFYRLPEPAAAQASAVVPGTVAVASLRSDSLHRERAILYVDSQKPLQIKRYHYHFWMDSPPKLIQENFLAFLRKAGFADHVVRTGQGRLSDHVIKGRLNRFERLIEENASQVIVSVELEYASKNTRLPGLRKQYQIIRNVNGPSIHNAVEAFGLALSEIYENFISDVANLAKP